MALARILKPSKTAMSSGRRKTRNWVLEFEPATRRGPDPLMGWIGCADTLNQIRIEFPTLDEAVAYADRHGIEYTLEEPHERLIKPKAYADNFLYDKAK